MVIKYCKCCEGQPYTKDLQMDMCPECKSILEIGLVDDEELDSRAMLRAQENQNTNNDDAFPIDEDYTGTENLPEVKQEGGLRVVDEEDSPVIVQDPGANRNVRPQNVIRGKVYRYSSTGREDGGYRRILPVKLFQAVVYRQRLEDVLHRFSVKVSFDSDTMGYENSMDIPVNVHGTIAGGAQIMDNDEVEIHGKYLNENFMAEEIYLLNNGYRTQVRFQRSVGTIVGGIILAIIMIMACCISGSIGGDFFSNLGTFFVGWAASFLLVTIIFFLLGLTRIGLAIRMRGDGKRPFPFFVILVIGAVLSLLFLNLPAFF